MNKQWYIKALPAILLSAASVAGVRADIVMTVDVSDMTASKVAVVYQTTVVEIPLDANGHGEHTFRNIGGVHAALYYGMDSKNIFIEDGDSIGVTFGGNTFKDSVKWNIKGGKEKIFNYLNQVKLPEIPDEKYAMAFADFVDFINKREESAQKILRAWKLEEVSPRFATVEAGRIHYAYVSAILMYAAGHPYVTQDTAYVPDKAYYDEVKRNAVEDENLVELKEYREYMKEVANIFGCKRGGSKTAYERTVCMMEYIADNIENDKVKQTLLNTLAIEQVEQYGIKDIDELTNLHSTYVTDPVLQAAFKEKYDAWDVTRPGRPSPDFRAFDVDGKAYSLADFKGRYVYIDLWATWCGPCRYETPFLEKLTSEFKNRNIAFVSLSTDSRKADWLKMVQGKNMSGIQLFLGTGSRFQTAYKADGIPHFILVDPEGNIVSANMLRPSSSDIYDYLDKLPGM